MLERANSCSERVLCESPVVVEAPEETSRHQQRSFRPQWSRGLQNKIGERTMKMLAGIHVAIVGLALMLFSGHAHSATLCNTGPAGPLGPNPPLSGTVTSGVVVNAGAFCVISGATVSGGVRVTPGGILVVCGSTINGGFTANGAAELIFGAEEIGCEGNLINGTVKVSNTGPG